MEFVLEHWLAIGTAVFLLGMVLYGHYKGFMRMALSMTALLLTLIIVRMATPYVSELLRENTFVHKTIERGLMKATGVEQTPELEAQLPADQRSLIEHLKLPEQMQQALIENNNSEIYELLGVNAFADYIGAYITKVVLNLISAVLLFIVVFIGIRLIIRWLDVLARLPILSGINQIAGALLGGIEGLLIIWVLCLVVTACATTEWGRVTLEQIEQNAWLLFLYKNNVFHWLISGILGSLR